MFLGVFFVLVVMLVGGCGGLRLGGLIFLGRFGVFRGMYICEFVSRRDREREGI